MKLCWSLCWFLCVTNCTNPRCLNCSRKNNNECRECENGYGGAKCDKCKEENCSYDCEQCAENYCLEYYEVKDT